MIGLIRLELLLLVPTASCNRRTSLCPSLGGTNPPFPQTLLCTIMLTTFFYVATVLFTAVVQAAEYSNEFKVRRHVGGASTCRCWGIERI